MRASRETYEEVARRCSSYSKNKSGCGCFQNADDCTASCLNCEHFTANESCVLDLYDPIVATMK